MFAFIGLVIVAIAEIIARASKELTHPAFNVLSAAAVLVALAAGFYAQTTQLHRWSRSVKRRLLIGMPVALLTGLVVIDNFYDKYDVPDRPVTDQPIRPTKTEDPSEDNALVKPGWYGEFQQGGLFLVVASFEDNAADAKRFCRRLFKPVSFATLSLINLGSPEPVVLKSLQVVLRMDSGEEIQSLAVKPLLEQKAGANADLLQSLTVPRTLAAGAMFPDIPVCQETNFPWAHVSAVTVSLSSRNITIPGRMMTVNEKQMMLDKASVSRQPNNTNITAEAWFKHL